MRRHLTLEVIVLALFVGSLVMPAIVVEEQPLFGGTWSTRSLWGIHCLALGFFVLPAWLANPFLLVAVVLHALRVRHAAIAVSVLAVLSSLIAPWLLRDLEHMRLQDVHVGYVCWVASMFAMLALAIRGRRVESIRRDLHPSR
jgi:hypothetical protein